MPINSRGISIERDERVAYLILDRPPANAYTLDLLASLHEAVVTLEHDDSVRVVVVKSGSEKFFCAGADIAVFSENSTDENQHMVVQAKVTSAAIESSSKLYIAAIAGHALGGGLELAMACDLRVAKEGSYALGLPEIKLGLIPGNGGTQRFLRLVGYATAMQYLCAGDTFSVEQAHTWGLVNQLFPKSEFERLCKAFARKYTELPPLALAATKRVLQGSTGLPFAQGLALEKRECDALYDTADAKEGFHAFIEKRAPIFQGR